MRRRTTACRLDAEDSCRARTAETKICSRAYVMSVIKARRYAPVKLSGHMRHTRDVRGPRVHATSSFSKELLEKLYGIPTYGERERRVQRLHQLFRRNGERYTGVSAASPYDVTYGVNTYTRACIIIRASLCELPSITHADTRSRLLDFYCARVDISL